jgi:hypothetical protein
VLREEVRESSCACIKTNKSLFTFSLNSLKLNFTHKFNYFHHFKRKIEYKKISLPELRPKYLLKDFFPSYFFLPFIRFANVESCVLSCCDSAANAFFYLLCVEHERECKRDTRRELIKKKKLHNNMQFKFQHLLLI